MLPKGFADLCTSFLRHSPPAPFAHTSDQSVCSDLTEDIKNGAFTVNVLTDTCTRFCTLGLNLSMTSGAGTFLTGFKKATFLGGGKKQIKQLNCAHS